MRGKKKTDQPDKTRPEKTRKDEAGQDKTRPEKTRQDKTRQDKTGQNLRVYSRSRHPGQHDNGQCTPHQQSFRGTK